MREQADEWNVVAEQVRRDLILAIEPHLESSRGDEAVEWIIKLESN
jgi:hypothetical protein